MNSDDPFSERDDGERTVIRPNPGGRRPAQPAPQAPPAVTATPTPVPDENFGYGIPGATARPRSPGPLGPDEFAALALSFTGLNPLVASAAPLFALVSRIRNRAQHADPERLRQSVIGEVREFESRALKAGCDAKDIKVARYAICATLDDVVLNTPWGESSVWQQQSMVATFHREVVGGDRFYDLLARLEQDPANNIEMLEFIYLCLSLGFEGRLRVEQGGRERHREIRAGLARLIRAQRGAVDSELSPHWQGLEVPNRTLSLWRPVWIAMGCAAAVMVAGFVGFSWALGGATEQITGRLSALEPGIAPTIAIKAPPPPPPPPQAEPLPEKFRAFLKAEIDEGLVEVDSKGNTLIIRLTGSGLFGSGSNVLAEQYREPVQRVALALNDEPGPVIVVGHSDNVPIRSSRYASNMELSLARAESVRKLMAPDLDDPKRLSAEGRAEREPLATNDTREGRARNRRIEILLVRVGDE
ncbi:type IVB secretion system protein IcmH/DotU [Tropicimonas sp.]|uniref:type IVB secretion system protein IcmH/DotU n=1 Tax=Tropicimonas sp. TaxID=2067044 RepID=UPI003A8C842F